MALIKCPDCKKDISDSAAACPFCGRPKSVYNFQLPGGMPSCPSCHGYNVGKIPVGFRLLGLRHHKCWGCGHTW
jgi:hypothetical protein